MSNERVSNERVIEELTAGLAECMKPRNTPESSAGHSGDTPSPEDVTAKESTEKSSLEESKGDSDKKHIDPYLEGSEFDEDHKEKSDDDEDYVDEEALKDAEVELTDDQKAERKIIAEELKSSGNDAFKRGDYELSIEKYTEGLRQCPLAYSRDRAILYCNRSAAKMKLEKYKKAIGDCSKAIELDDRYLKAYIRRAQSHESADQLDEALADFKKILELDPEHQEARRAVTRLPPLIEERNEKLKTEMLGKLKELGNMFLKPFGLSTENFNLQQDPESKGYSINFKQ